MAPLNDKNAEDALNVKAGNWQSLEIAKSLVQPMLTWSEYLGDFFGELWGNVVSQETSPEKSSQLAEIILKKLNEFTNPEDFFRALESKLEIVSLPEELTNHCGRRTIYIEGALIRLKPQLPPPRKTVANEEQALQVQQKPSDIIIEALAKIKFSLALKKLATHPTEGFNEKLYQFLVEADLVLHQELSLPFSKLFHEMYEKSLMLPALREPRIYLSQNEANGIKVKVEHEVILRTLSNDGSVKDASNIPIGKGYYEFYVDHEINILIDNNVLIGAAYVTSDKSNNPNQLETNKDLLKKRMPVKLDPYSTQETNTEENSGFKECFQRAEEYKKEFLHADRNTKMKEKLFLYETYGGREKSVSPNTKACEATKASSPSIQYSLSRMLFACKEGMENMVKRTQVTVLKNIQKLTSSK